MMGNFGYGCKSVDGMRMGESQGITVGVHNFTGAVSPTDWHLRLERMNAEINCLTCDHRASANLTQKLAVQAQEISIRGLYSPSFVLIELFDEVRLRLASGESVEVVGAWLDSLANK